MAESGDVEMAGDAVVEVGETGLFADAPGDEVEEELAVETPAARVTFVELASPFAQPTIHDRRYLPTGS